jgi:hypothetical protein
VGRARRSVQRRPPAPPSRTCAPSFAQVVRSDTCHSQVRYAPPASNAPLGIVTDRADGPWSLSPVTKIANLQVKGSICTLHLH